MKKKTERKVLREMMEDVYRKKEEEKKKRRFLSMKWSREVVVEAEFNAKAAGSILADPGTTGGGLNFAISFFEVLFGFFEFGGEGVDDEGDGEVKTDEDTDGIEGDEEEAGVQASDGDEALDDDLPIIHDLKSKVSSMNSPVQYRV